MDRAAVLILKKNYLKKFYFVFHNIIHTSGKNVEGKNQYITDLSTVNLTIKLLSYDGKTIGDVNATSMFGHSQSGTKIGKYKNKPFVVGGLESNSEVESLNKQENEFFWKREEQYPFHTS